MVRILCSTDSRLSPRRVKNALVHVLPRANGSNGFNRSNVGHSRSVNGRTKLPSELGPPPAVVDLEWLHQVSV